VHLFRKGRQENEMWTHMKIETKVHLKMQVGRREKKTRVMYHLRRMKMNKLNPGHNSTCKEY
jgi:hypothetical protein